MCRLPPNLQLLFKSQLSPIDNQATVVVTVHVHIGFQRQHSMLGYRRSSCHRHREFVLTFMLTFAAYALIRV